MALKTVIESDRLIKTNQLAPIVGDPERESNIWRNEDGSPIENSSPEDLERERWKLQKLKDRKRHGGRK